MILTALIDFVLFNILMRTLRVQKGVAVKKTYLTPESEVILFKLRDIITTSGGNDSTGSENDNLSSDMSGGGWTGW